MVPDEILFQTIMGNYGCANSELIRDTLHFVEWNRPGATLTLEDRMNIFLTHHLFARKFDNSLDSRIADWIDRHILNTV